MAVSPIIKYIYNHGSDEVIRRGKRIFLTQGVKLVRKEDFTNQLIFKVRNDQYYNQYNVTVSKYLDEQTLSARCQCPYNMGEICRHEAAALFQLNDMILNQTLDAGRASFQQSHTMVRMPSIDLKSLRLFTSDRLFEEAEQLVKMNRVKIQSAANELVQAEAEEERGTYQIKLKRNDDKSFDTSCTCDETRHPLCKHKTALFLQLLNHHGPQYFDTIRNWDSQKNKLLSLYGYSLSDDLSGKFEFYYQDAKPFLKVLDPSIKKVSAAFNAPPVKEREAVPVPVVSTADYSKRIGVVINLQEKVYPYFSIDLVEGEMTPGEERFAGMISKLDLTKYVNPERYVTEDRELLTWGRKLQRAEINRYIAKNSPFGDLWENIIHSADDLSSESKELLYDYIHAKLLKLFNTLGLHNPVYLLPQGKPYRASSLQSVRYRHHQLYPILKVAKGKDQVQIDILLHADEEKFAHSENKLNNSLLYLIEDELFLINKAVDAARISVLLDLQKSEQTDWSRTMADHILPLSKHYEVEFEDGLIEYRQATEPVRALQLSEQGSYFIIKPVFQYGDVMAEWNDEHHISRLEDGRVLMIQRDKQAELAFVSMLQALHANLKKPEFEHHFAIHAKHALAQNWFFQFFDRLKQENILVYGYDDLRQFRIKKAKPNTKVYISSGQDWFDTELEIDFDGQAANLASVQKALAAKQNYIRLDDGTYGLLPDEWLKKFSLLFKMAEANGQTLKVSKYNFSVIDELHDLIDDEAVRQELMEKKEILLGENPERFQAIPVPEELQAELRPYQVAGFRWLCYLDSVSWGGLLADDMGLGKTIQTLSFLQYYKNKNESLQAIVVCPTTLLYNWENEINKFTPGLSYIIHHGPSRTSHPEELQDYDIILSTYGTLRSDVEMFVKNRYDYIVLDESQTIKNPSSKVAKAVQLLYCKNRIALSGTPMQNNTFDIYSQMNFLNPGMLGSKEFFKQEFAKPVDKFQEEETKQHLRKLIYPFLLRRTKEQVARDLPEKTEVTLYCEMGAEQRVIYDTYRNRYRSQILGTIDEQGIQKSQFAILQGLMKLRQICDSPAILNDGTHYDHHSVKLDELVREITENVGQHKALVFSQFLGMLGLIRAKLTELGIRYQYFDGSYTAQQREQAIRDFQDNEECSVFLISLKAGGMGLNLTAADYVYIVDPWWNPAVEQQAIDRTHRIGQTKNIFAYRMICRDTVEEKIMKLKEKKNLLVKDIVSDDSGMIKQLTKEDVQYLFS